MPEDPVGEPYQMATTRLLAVTEFTLYDKTVRREVIEVCWNRDRYTNGPARWYSPNHTFDRITHWRPLPSFPDESTRGDNIALWLNMQTALHDPSPTSPDDMIEKVTRLVRRLRTLEEAPAGARLRWTEDGSPFFEGARHVDENRSEPRK